MRELIFKKLSLENFLSFGPKVEVNLASYSGLIYVKGKNLDVPGSNNGVGKSTLLVDSLCFALFGKPQRSISKDCIPCRQMPNDVDVTVELELDIDGKNWKISTGYHMPGLKPFFDLTVDGATPSEVANHSAKTLRTWFESEILQFSYEMFKSYIVLSADGSNMFFKMSKSERRSYVEKSFNLEIFGLMLKEVRKDLNNIQKQLAVSQGILNRETENLTTIKAEDRDFEISKAESISNIEKNIKKIQTALDNMSIDIISDADIKLIETQYDECQAALTDLKNKLNSTEQQKNNLIQLKSIKQKELTKHDDILKAVCSNCNMVLTEKYKLSDITSEISKTDIKLNDINAQILNMTSVIVDKQTEFESISSEFNRITRIKDEQNKLSSKKIQLTSLLTSEKLKLEQTKILKNPYVNLINDTEKKIQNLKKDIDSNSRFIEILSVNESIVDEEGVKRDFLTDTVNTLNDRVRYYLDVFGSRYICEFDDSFECKFLTESGPAEYDCFSTGEKGRIDLSILLAFRDIVSLKQMSSSIIVLDEFFDRGIDAYALNALVKLLKSLNTTAFVISHKFDCICDEDFDGEISLEKQNGITSIEIK